MPDGVNPTVDTNLGPASMGATGTIGLMNDLAEMRNRQNANVLFQQQMSARHQLGEDLTVWASQGLSPEEQIAKASHQPYAPFVTPEISNFRASNLAGVQVQHNQAEIEELHQRMVNNGLGPLSQALAATGGDPKKFDDAFKIATAGYPPDLQDDMKKVHSAMTSFITGGTSADPDAAKAQMIANTARLGASLGLPLDKVLGMSGAVVPQVAEMPGGGKSVVGGLPGQVPPALTPQPSGSTGSPVLGANPPAKALDGSALFAPDSALPPQFKTNLTGTKAFPSEQASQLATEATKAWQEAQPRYEQVAQSIGSIGNMMDEIKFSAAKGGFLQPGFAGNTRTAAANAVNTAYSWFNPGKEPPIDVAHVAANEAVMKGAKAAAFQVVSQATGQSREALGTLQMGYDSIPNMDKTPLGSIIVGETMNATGNWLLQKQQFQRDWMARTGGDLTNYEAEYLKEHPPEKVMQGILGAHGIGPDGYTSRAAFLKDFHDGLLTSGKDAPLETAATIAHSKGWITDEQYKTAKASGFKSLAGTPTGSTAP